jgi:hypothetical protein
VFGSPGGTRLKEEFKQFWTVIKSAKLAGKVLKVLFQALFSFAVEHTEIQAPSKATDSCSGK